MIFLTEACWVVFANRHYSFDKPNRFLRHTSDSMYIHMNKSLPQMSNQVVQGTLDILLSLLTSVFLSTRSLFHSVLIPSWSLAIRSHYFRNSCSSYHRNNCLSHRISPPRWNQHSVTSPSSGAELLKPWPTQWTCWLCEKCLLLSEIMTRLFDSPWVNHRCPSQLVVESPFISTPRNPEKT